MAQEVERVPMSHPDLPEQDIMVRPAGVAARQKRGWKLGKTTAAPDAATQSSRSRRTEPAPS